MHQRLITLAALVSTCVATFAHAQQMEANLGALTAENAKGYLDPLRQPLSGTMNAAVFQTGHVPQTGFGLQFGVQLMGVSLSSSDRTYTPTDPSGYSSVNASTVIGDTHAVASNGPGGATIYHPGGFDINEFALAVPQLTIGSIAGTRAVVRYVSLDVGDDELGHFSLWGVGGQHSLSHYLKDLPLEVAVGAFYQHMTLGSGDLVKANTFAVNATGSKRMGHYFEPYVGIGLDNFKMEANYQASSTGENVHVELDSSTDFHLTGGLQLVMPGVHLYVEGNIAATNGAAVGLMFGN
jgi:uncharacterized protein DUF6588